MPAFKVDMTFSGLTTTAWVTDTGEIVREESPMGLITILETQEQATALGVSNRDAAKTCSRHAAIVPRMAAADASTSRATSSGCGSG